MLVLNGRSIPRLGLLTPCVSFLWVVLVLNDRSIPKLGLLTPCVSFLWVVLVLRNTGVDNSTLWHHRNANICILQSGRFCPTTREIFRITFNIIGTVSVFREIFKLVHQNIERLVYFQGTFCRIRKSWQLWQGLLITVSVSRKYHQIIIWPWNN